MAAIDCFPRSGNKYNDECADEHDEMCDDGHGDEYDDQLTVISSMIDSMFKLFPILQVLPLTLYHF